MYYLLSFWRSLWCHNQNKVTGANDFKVGDSTKLRNMKNSVNKRMLWELLIVVFKVFCCVITKRKSQGQMISKSGKSASWYRKSDEKCILFSKLGKSANWFRKSDDKCILLHFSSAQKQDEWMKRKELVSFRCRRETPAGNQWNPDRAENPLINV